MIFLCLGVPVTLRLITYFPLQEMKCNEEWHLGAAVHQMAIDHHLVDQAASGEVFQMVLSGGKFFLFGWRTVLLS